MTADDPLDRLQRWYLEQCDGEWEHGYGVSVDTLDNPGWRVRVDLAGTALEGRAFARLEDHRSEDDWVVAWVDGSQFEAACGPLNLGETIKAFLSWAE